MRWNDPDVYEPTSLPQLEMSADDVIALLKPQVTEERWQRICDVAAKRRDDVTVVLGALSDPHNASAIMRSCDAFGVHKLFALDGKYGFNAAHRISKGADRWLEIERHEKPKECVKAVKDAGYHITIATMDGERTPEELASIDKVAIVFGNERDGVSDVFREAADSSYRIPMVGFVESLNVSVAAATTLYNATRRDTVISDQKQKEIIARFLMRSVRSSDDILKLGFDAPDIERASLENQ